MATKFERREIPKKLRASAKTMRVAATDAEAKLWLLLRDRRLAGCKFRRQVPVGNHIADFASYPSRLIVEVDGGQHSDSTRDGVRDRWLESQNFRVVRYWNNDVLGNPEGILENLLAVIEQQKS